MLKVSIVLSALIILAGCDQKEISQQEQSLNAQIEPTDGAKAELIIGRWCDRMLPKYPEYWVVLEIISSGDRTFERMIQSGGTVSETRLVEQGGNLFANPDSPSGDAYRIVPNDGSLQLIDDDGLIRVATRLENEPQSGECFGP